MQVNYQEQKLTQIKSDILLLENIAKSRKVKAKERELALKRLTKLKRDRAKYETFVGLKKDDLVSLKGRLGILKLVENEFVWVKWEDVLTLESHCPSTLTKVPREQALWEWDGSSLRREFDGKECFDLAYLYEVRSQESGVRSKLLNSDSSLLTTYARSRYNQIVREDFRIYDLVIRDGNLLRITNVGYDSEEFLVFHLENTAGYCYPHLIQKVAIAKQIKSSQKSGVSSQK